MKISTVVDEPEHSQLPFLMKTWWVPPFSNFSADTDSLTSSMLLLLLKAFGEGPPETGHCVPGKGYLPFFLSLALL